MRRRAVARTAVVGGLPASAPSTVDQVKELAELREQGILTEEEFAAEKKKLLAL